MKDKKIEACNRCCSYDVTLINDIVTCNNCNHSEQYKDWQLIGWRDIKDNPPHFKGTIHIYGPEIGRTMANWDSINKTCDNKDATHWLRVPDPTKQINMERFMINKKLITDLYDEQEDGIIQSKEFITKKELNKIMIEINKNQDSFEKKDEKYIENNQEVALIYRGPFSLEGLNNSVFENLFKKYIKIRSQIEDSSAIPFDKGNVIEVKIIKYPISELGVGTHRDLSSNVNMITFFNLFGKVKLHTYKDKEGNKINSYLMEPGDLTIMRAPRLNEEKDIRPLHGVEEVYEKRLVLAIREIKTDLEELTNKDNWRGF